MKELLKQKLFKQLLKQKSLKELLKQKKLLVIGGSLAALIIVIVLCISMSKSSNTRVNDDVFVMMKDSDLYIQYPGKEAEKVAVDVLSQHAKYVDGKNGLYYVDQDNSLYRYIDGENEKLGDDIDTSSYLPFHVSMDGNIVTYMTEEDTLYAYREDGGKVKVASDVSYDFVSDNGDYIYYKTNDDELYVYTKDDEKEKIASDVYQFTISPDGSKVLYHTNEDALYLKAADKDEKERIASEAEDVSWLSVEDDGALAYLSESESEKEELYWKPSDQEESERIASDVDEYSLQGDTLYYLNTEEELYTANAKDGKSEKLADDVSVFYDEDGKTYYLTNEGTLYTIKGDQSEKIGTYTSNYIDRALRGDKVIYLTEDHVLYVNDEKIAANVSKFVAYVDKVVYYTEDERIESVSIDKLSKKETFDDLSEYGKIYYGNQLLYSNYLTAESLNGIWEVEGDMYNTEADFIEIDAVGDSYVSFRVYEDGYSDFEKPVVTKATEDSLTFNKEYLFTQIDESTWKVYYDDDYVYLEKSTEADLEDYIDEEDDYDYDYDYDSY